MNIKLALTLRFVAIVTLIMAGFSYVVYKSFMSYTDKEYTSRLSDRTTAIADVLLDTKQQDSLNYLPAENLLIRQKISIYTLAQKRITNNNTSVNTADTTVLAKIKTQASFSVVVSDTHFVGYLFKHNNNTYYIVGSAVDENRTTQSSSLARILSLLFFVGILLSGIIGFIFANLALSPINEVINDVDKITANSLFKRLKSTHKNDEIGALNDTFNKMLDRLETSFVMQKNFVSNASHEFRTPITAIKGQIDVLLMQERTKEEYINTIQSVSDDINHFMELMQSLSELAKANMDGLSDQNNNIPIIEVIAEVRAELIKSKPRYRINLNIENIPEFEHENYVIGNESLLKSAFKNVIENACKFSPDQKCDVRIWFADKQIHVKITDEGIGIAAEELPHIFEPFYRANDTRGIAGHGIGLSLVKKIIELHSGVIEVNSTQSKGTELLIKLPQLTLID